MTKTISIYFNAADDSVQTSPYGYISLANLLHGMTVSNQRDLVSFCVNGCAVNNPDWRDLQGLFNFHLEKQVECIAKRIHEISKEQKIILNIFGYSRGGAAAFLLCQSLKKIDKKKICINVVAIEPITGNFMTCVYGDIFFAIHSSLTSLVADLSACHNIGSMFILYTNTAMPSIACHAPVLPKFPQCKLEIDVTPGTHHGAVSYYMQQNYVEAVNIESQLVYQRVIEFMQKNGTKFNFNVFKMASNLRPLEDLKNESSRLEWLNLYREIVQKSYYLDNPHTKTMHFNGLISTKRRSKLFLNNHHQKLFLDGPVNEDNNILSIHQKPMIKITSEYSDKLRIISLALFLASCWVLYEKFFVEEQSDSYRFTS